METLTQLRDLRSRRRLRTSAIKPVPNRTTVAGSGTAATVTTEVGLYTIWSCAGVPFAQNADDRAGGAGALRRRRTDQSAAPPGNHAGVGQRHPADRPRQLLECRGVREAGRRAARVRVLRRRPLQERGLATQSLEAPGGRFIFDFAAFAPTSDITIELAGTGKTHACLVERSVLTLFR